MTELELVVMDSAINILLVDSDGSVKKTTLTEILDEIYGPNLCPSGDILNPVWANGLNKIFVPCPQVSVGVGVENPMHKLHVGGTTYAHKFLAGNVDAITSALLNVYAENNSQNLLQLGVKIGSSSQEIRFIVSNDGKVEIHNNGSDHSLEIYNGSGHVILVHAQNGSKILQLQDNGLLNTREVKVNTNTWPDYVFEKEHGYLSLSETNEYIETNGRLPGMPSAERIITEGLNLGEMQIKQMEKIEEIYLHLIELDKRVKELEQENQRLREEIGKK